MTDPETLATVRELRALAIRGTHGGELMFRAAELLEARGPRGAQIAPSDAAVDAVLRFNLGLSPNVALVDADYSRAWIREALQVAYSADFGVRDAEDDETTKLLLAEGARWRFGQAQDEAKSVAGELRGLAETSRTIAAAYDNTPDTWSATLERAAKLLDLVRVSPERAPPDTEMSDDDEIAAWRTLELTRQRKATGKPLLWLKWHVLPESERETWRAKFGGRVGGDLSAP